MNKVENSSQRETEQVLGGSGASIQLYGEGYLFDGGIIRVRVGARFSGF